MSLLSSPNAVIAWGVLGERGSPDDLVERVVGGTARLHIAQDPDTARVDDVAALEGAWHSVLAGHDPGFHDVGIRAIVDMDPGLDRDAVSRSIRGADGVASLYFVEKRLEDHGDFHWPLRIAFGAGEAARQAVETYHHGDLIENQGRVKARRRYDLVFLTESDLRRLHRDRGRVGAGLVVHFVERPADICMDVATRVTESVSASAVCVAGLPSDMTGFVSELLDQIAHNLPLDVACGRAVSACGSPDDRWVMIAQPAYVESAKVTAAVARMRKDAEDRFNEGLLDVKDFEHVIDVLGPVARMGDAVFMAESGGATEIAGRVGHVRPVLEGGGPVLRGGTHGGTSGPSERTPPSQVRQLQAQVHARMPSGLVQRKQSFEPGADHTINMRIGRSNLDWMAVEVPFPETLLPPHERFHELDVHIIAPGLFSGEKCETIVLGQGAESMVAAFDVSVPADLDAVHISVSVWRGTTHLQSATLKGPVRAGDEAPGGKGIQFTTGDRNTADLDRKEEVDLSFIQQAGQLWMKKKGERRLIDLPDVKTAVDGIRDTLFEGAHIANIPGIKLGDEDVLPMLRMLVEQGEFIRRTLFGDDPLDGVRIVDVTSASSGEFLPVEFFYDYPLPERDAELCSAFSKSTGWGCDACEALKSRSRLCPSGFWAMRKVIQRQIHAVGTSLPDQPDVTERFDRLPDTRNIVFAASDEVNTSSDPKRIQNTIDALKRLGANVYPADSWDAWEDEIEDHPPALLLALPHNVDTETKFQALQIAKDQNLELNRITERHVCPSREGPGPLMFLLGCNTANPSVGYQDFIRQVRCMGASVVVGTLTYVLGPQAAPVATEFVRALWAAEPGSTIGELLPQVRATMLRADNPMALALVAYGDADWKIG